MLISPQSVFFSAWQLAFNPSNLCYNATTTRKMQDKTKDLAYHSPPAHLLNKDDMPAYPDPESMPGNMPPTKANSQMSSKQESNVELVSVNGHTEVSEDGEPEYPSSWRLAVIMLGLCFAVFCMALVCKR